MKKEQHMEEKKSLKCGLMIKKLSLVFVVILLYGCSDNNRYKKVLGDLYNYSYYVSLVVIYDKQQMRIVIENADLSYMLEKEEGITQSMYYEQMGKVLNKKTPLIVNKHTFLSLKEYQVVPTKKVDNLKKEGINNLIKSLFNEYGALTTPLSEMDKKYVIDILFQNDIFTKMDCESGYIYIPGWTIR